MNSNSVLSLTATAVTGMTQTVGQTNNLVSNQKQGNMDASVIG